LLRGLYISASGMLTDEIRHQVISNNLANANTIGYKKDLVIGQTFPEVLMRCLYKGQSKAIGQTNLGAGVCDIPIKMTPGMIETTNSALDLALEGDGFFVLETLVGRRITRQGNFRLDKEGYLTNMNGDLLLGENGFIKIDPNGETLKVLADGSIFQGSIFVDKLLLVNYTPSALLKEGNSRFIVTEPGEVLDTKPEVIQGALERSNVNIIEEMVAMINLMRTYESEQKVIQAQNETLGKLINEMANI